MRYAFDVAVVGYGPTGLTAASLLGRLGHRIIVCERWPTLYGLPRLTSIDGETARTVQAAGDSDAALRDSSVSHYLWVNGTGQKLMNLRNAEDGPMGYPTHISMYQPYLEDAIHQRVASYPNVELRQGWTVTELEQTPAAVALTLRPSSADPLHTAGSRFDRLSARYVIAADGSRSSMRELLGVPRDDYGFNERWLNIDAEWLRPQPPEYATGIQYCDPNRGHMTINIGQSRQRFEFAVHPDETDEEMTNPARGWRFLADYHQLGPADLRVIRQIVYKFEARIATQWRHQRVFLAGDAAHTMPPYLGQGACSGIRDATNLAWKLHLVLTNRAGDGLLDSYQQERHPHVTAITQMAIGLGAVANMHDPAQATARDAAFAAGHAPPAAALPVLGEGVLQPGSKVAGRLTPQGRIGLPDGTRCRFDELCGYGFVLVTRHDPTAALGEQALSTLKQLGCAIVDLGSVDDLDARHGAFLDELGAVAYLARPDFVLFGIASDDGELVALVDDLSAAVSAARVAAR